MGTGTVADFAGLDVLNSVLEEMKEPMLNSFTQRLIFWPELEKRGKNSTAKGQFISRPALTGSPARARAMKTGDEELDTTRRETSVKFLVEPTMIGAAITIPKKDMNLTSGTAAAVSLVEQYPKAFLDALNIDLEKWLLCAASANLAIDSSELAGLATLNGEFGAGEGVGMLNGWFDFATPAAQSAAAKVVQGVARNLAKYLYSQYQFIAGGWAAGDGYNRWRKLYRQCAQFSTGKGPDLIIASDGLYGNLTGSKTDLVRVSKVSDDYDGEVLETTFMGAKVRTSQLIVPAVDFAGTGAGGLAYFLDTRLMETIWYEKPNMSKFEFKSDRQLVATAMFAMHCQLMFQRPTAFGVLAGGDAA